VRGDKTMKPKAYSYLRFSTPEQSKGDSFRRQTENARRYAEANGLELDETLNFHDKGISAFRSTNVKIGMLGAFLEAVSTGVVAKGSYLLVESLDRLSRDTILEAQTLFQQIILSGIIIVSLIDNKVYSRESITANPIDMIVSLLSMMRAHEESETKSRRLKAAWGNKRNIAGTKPMTAKAPGWLRLVEKDGKRHFEVIEERAAVVCRIYDMTLKGIGQHTITKTLNEENVPVFGRAKFWQRTYVIKLLENEAVIGTYTPHTLEFVDRKKTRKPQAKIAGYFPAIIKKKMFDRVQALRMDKTTPLRGRHAGKELRNIFGGIAQCPLCGSTATLVNKGKRGGKTFLVCTKAKTGAGCKYKGIPLDQVESAFLSGYERLLHEIPAGDAENEIQERIEQIQTGIDVDKEELARMIDTFPTKASPTLTRKIREYEDEIERMERELDSLYQRKNVTMGPVVEKKIDELCKLLKRKPINRLEVNTLLRQLVNAVVINYPNGTLDFHWRHGGENFLVYSMPEEHVVGGRKKPRK
jgi:DNA invertase Pin-like site-specific DNA recombinase